MFLIEFNSQGNVHFKNGNLDQAMTCYFEAVKFNPNDMNIYGNMAQVMIRKSEYETVVIQKLSNFKK